MSVGMRVYICVYVCVSVSVFQTIHIFKQSRSGVCQNVLLANAGWVYPLAASCLDSGEPFWLDSHISRAVSFSVHHIKRCMMSACDIILDVKGEAF